jgi:hypothetical protein
VAQALFCTQCKIAYTAELSGRSCPACGEELIKGRLPAVHNYTHARKKKTYASRAVWDHIIKRDPCVFCGGDADTVDHIHPKALGGSKGSWDNRTGACLRCNQDKAHTPLLFFLLQRSGLDLSPIMDEEGRWIIDETPDEIIARVAAEEQYAKDAHFDPRKILLDE